MANNSTTNATTRRLFRAGLITMCSAGRLLALHDAAMLVHNGRIRMVGDFDNPPPHDELVELDAVLLPGFADVHTHWVQHHVRGRFGGDVLEWLEKYILPEEATFGEARLAQQRAEQFFSDTLQAGTVMGMAYSSVHPAALDIALAETTGRWRLGNSLMDRLAPPSLLDAAVCDLHVLEELALRYGRERYALTPRFAPAMSPGFLQQTGTLARELGLWVQTHLSESVHEVALLHELFPEALDYVDVYDQAGLVTSRSVFGHGIHLSEREWRCLAQKGAWLAHCPSSNEALDSGRMDLQAARRFGVPFALGSDVAAGPSHSMLHVMQRFLAVHRAAGVSLDASEALHRATLAGAQCLGWQHDLGSLETGKRADFVVMPRPAGHWQAEGYLEELLTGSSAELEQRALGTYLAGTLVTHSQAQQVA